MMFRRILGAAVVSTCGAAMLMAGAAASPADPQNDYSYWLTNGQATVYNGPPAGTGPGYDSADFIILPDHTVLVKIHNSYDESFSIPVTDGPDGTLEGSSAMPWWGNGGDVMHLRMQPIAMEAGGVSKAKVYAHDDYNAFYWGDPTTSGSMATRVGPAPCGSLPTAWYGVSFDGSAYGHQQVRLKFTTGQNDRVHTEATYSDEGGEYDFNPDHDIAPDANGALSWETGSGPIFKNVGTIQAEACSPAGKVNEVHAKGATFPDFGFEGDLYNTGD